MKKLNYIILVLALLFCVCIYKYSRNAIELVNFKLYDILSESNETLDGKFLEVLKPIESGSEKVLKTRITPPGIYHYESPIYKIGKHRNYDFPIFAKMGLDVFINSVSTDGLDFEIRTTEYLFRENPDRFVTRSSGGKTSSKKLTCGNFTGANGNIALAYYRDPEDKSLNLCLLISYADNSNYLMQRFSKDNRFSRETVKELAESEFDGKILILSWPENQEVEK